MQHLDDAMCAFSGHPWQLGDPEPVTGTRFWRCPRCHVSGGTSSQHHGAPSRWLFTFWKGYEASVISLYIGRGSY